MNEKTSRILRWDKKKHISYSPENKGKSITDNNPYLNLDVKSFDLYTEIDPTSEKVNAVSIKRIWNFLGEKEETPELRKTFLKYIPGLIKGKQLQKNQHKKDDKVEVCHFKTKEQKQELKDQILNKLAEHDLIGGFTLLDRRYVNGELDKEFPYDTVLIIGSEMFKDSIMEIPHPTKESGIIFDFDVYHSGGLIVDEIANFIRSKGVKCRSHVPAGADFNFAPHAVNAGMGNYSTHGMVLTQKWGTRLRFFAISIDLDIPLDNAKDYNFEEFCKRCRMCCKSCPADAIPKHEAPYRGAVKRRVSPKRCGMTMSTNKFCGVCLKVCPFNNFGYDKCADTLPAYYSYNLMTQKNMNHDNK